MAQRDARILSVKPLSATSIGVAWDDTSGVATIELGGWITTGGAALSPLRQPDMFGTARVGDHGAAVIWGDEDGDLAIDAVHLKLIEDAQQAPSRLRAERKVAT